jgi:NADPH:quinone reductase-like Zn-dependent oxidoreductase
LVTAAASGVSRNLLALCQSKKIKVIAAVRSAASASMLRHNFNGLTVVNTENPDWKNVVKDVYGKAPTAIIDPIGGTLATELIKVIADEGILLSYGGLDHSPSAFSSIELTARHLTIRGLNSQKWIKGRSVEQKSTDIRELFGMARAFPQNFANCQSFPLAEPVEALAAARVSPRRGAILLTSE